MSNINTLPARKCPTCGYEMDAATQIHDVAAEVIGNCPPEVGDITLCVNCGDALEFAEGLKLQVASLDTLVKLSEKQHWAIEVAQKLIRKGERKS
jgi:hypothetical protein